MSQLHERLGVLRGATSRAQAEGAAALQLLEHERQVRGGWSGRVVQAGHAQGAVQRATGAVGARVSQAALAQERQCVLVAPVGMWGAGSSGRRAHQEAFCTRGTWIVSLPPGVRRAGLRVPVAGGGARRRDTAAEEAGKETERGCKGGFQGTGRNRLRACQQTACLSAQRHCLRGRSPQQQRDVIAEVTRCGWGIKRQEAGFSYFGVESGRSDAGLAQAITPLDHHAHRLAATAGARRTACLHTTAAVPWSCCPPQPQTPLPLRPPGRLPGG